MEDIKEHLRRLHGALLILDNFEHVLAAAPVVTDLLGASRELKILVTSRAALHLYGEQELQVPPLALPDPQHLCPVELLSGYPAVALFVQRARAVKPELLTRISLPLRLRPLTTTVSYRSTSPTQPG